MCSHLYSTQQLSMHPLLQKINEIKPDTYKYTKMENLRHNWKLTEIDEEVVKVTVEAQGVIVNEGWKKLIS